MGTTAYDFTPEGRRKERFFSNCLNRLKADAMKLWVLKQKGTKPKLRPITTVDIYPFADPRTSRVLLIA